MGKTIACDRETWGRRYESVVHRGWFRVRGSNVQLGGGASSRLYRSDGIERWQNGVESQKGGHGGSGGRFEALHWSPGYNLVEVFDRLSDSQSNLKPVAARLIGVIMSATDATSQAKLGKVVYGSLINSAMNDSRAVMHDACMEALKLGTSLPQAEGGGTNVQALEPFLIGLVGELDESDFKVRIFLLCDRDCV